MYLLPQPKKTNWQEGRFLLRYDTSIMIGNAAAAEEKELLLQYAHMLQAEITKATGLSLSVLRARNLVEKGGILLTVEPREIADQLADSPEQVPAGLLADSRNQESYKLTVTSDGITIAACTTAGVLYGVQTLRQMIRQAGAMLPTVIIEDAPDIAERGLSYDTTRGRVPTLEELKRQADLLSFYKMNQLQLYVEHSYLFREFGEVWRDDDPLTAEEILELDAYCRKLNIDLVPSLASFGHLYEVLRSKTYAHLCELEHSEEGEFSLVERMAHHTVDVSNEESFTMVSGRIEEFMGLFTSRYFNICADETFDLCKGRSKALGEEKGVKQVYLDFLKQLCGFIVSKGRIPMYWGDVLLEKPELLPEMPEDAICLNWEYWPQVTEDKVKILVDAGVKHLYLCPGVQSWNHLINRHKDAYQNIFLMCRNAHKFHAQGVLNTEWGDLGHVAHPEFSTIGQIYGAVFSWSDKELAEEEINKRISVIQYGDASGQAVNVFRNLAETECVNWWHAVQYKENKEGKLTNPKDQKLTRIIFAGEEDAVDGERVQEQLRRSDELLDKLYGLLPKVSQDMRQDVVAYIIMGQGQKLFTMTGHALYQYAEGEKVTYDCVKLAEQMEYWLMDYKKLWRSVSKESELVHITQVVCWYADRLREM